jgi:hypothetical protein
MTLAGISGGLWRIQFPGSLICLTRPAPALAGQCRQRRDVYIGDVYIGDAWGSDPGTALVAQGRITAAEASHPRPAAGLATQSASPSADGSWRVDAIPGRAGHG